MDDIQPQATPEQSGVNIYDISGPEPVQGTIGHHEVTDAVASGQFSLPKGSQVPVISPDGEHGTLDAAEAPEAFKNGYRYATPTDLEEHKFGSTGEQIKAGLEGVGQGLVGPVAPLVERAFGVENEDILKRAKYNPGTHAAGEMAGLVGGLLTGSGEAALAEKAGVAGAKALGLGEAATTGARIASGGARAAIENGFIQGSDELSKMFLNDPEQSVQTAVADVGLSGLLGGAIGASLGGGKALWDAAVGGKTAQLIEDFKGRLKYHTENPDPLAAVTDEFTNHYGNIRSIADEVYGAQGLKAQDIAKAMPEMSPKITAQVGDVNSKLESSLKKLSETDDPHLKLLSNEANKYQAVVTNPEATSGQIFDATQKLKQQLQEWGKFNKDIVPLSERGFRDTAKELAHDLRVSLEDPSVWGKAGERQQAINKAFTDFAPALKDFESKFTSKVAGEKTIDPGKIQTYMNQLGKNTSILKQGMVKDFLDASEKYLNVIDKTHSNLGMSPIDRTSVSAIRDTLKEMTKGAKLADYVVNKGAANLAGQGLGAAVGAGVGHSLGAGGIGALVGEHALGPFLSSVLPALTRPLMEKASNSVGLKAAADYAVTALKGENLIGKATKNVFKAGREVLPQSLIPSAKDKERLDKTVSSFRTDPTPLEKVGNQTAHYLPNHGTAAAQTASNAVNYLNSLRPNTDRQAPLDPKPIPNPVAKATYDRALGIAQQPLVVLSRLQAGTMTTGDVTALKAMYPALYTKFSNQLTEQMSSQIAKGDIIPYKTRLGLSVFLGQPVDSTMTPGSIMSAQLPAISNTPNPQQNSSKPPSSSSVKGLSKLPNQYQTNAQSREQSRITKD